MKLWKEGVTMIEITMLILFAISLLLFILSFFRKDKTAKLEKQIEDLSLTYMQEMYQLKKKIRLLEEELLISHEQSPFQANSSAQQKLFDEVLTYYKRGDDLRLIAKKTGLTYDEVEHLILPYLRTKGGGNHA